MTMAQERIWAVGPTETAGDYASLDEWTIGHRFSFYTLEVEGDEFAEIELGLDEAEALHAALGASLRRHGRL